MLYFFQQVLNGLHSGALYALLAFGYVLTNGILHRTNLAYGALFAFCGQTMILTVAFGYQVLWLTLLAAVVLGVVTAFLYAGLISHVLSRSVFEPLADRTPNAIVVTTLGILLVLSEASRIAADTHDWWLPPMLAQPVVFAQGAGFQATLTLIQLIDCAIVLAALMLAAWAFARSGFGRRWRAVSDDPHAAALCGVDVRRVFRQAVLFGGFCAALAGVMAGLYYGNVSFGSGLVYGLKILFVTAVGGYLSPPRAALGAAAFGMAESLWAGYFPIEWRDGWMYLFLVAALVLIGPGRDQQKIA
ncbi:branched-chain amino acid ABC transporter permease [Mesorhizobium caraganae]|uniref:branched-chain amino acid ABC transporter permease n=1 Tax=Mesorhizobium caraganae TaxID=483206 RepID=UPI003334FE09